MEYSCGLVKCQCNTIDCRSGRWIWLNQQEMTRVISKKLRLTRGFEIQPAHLHENIVSRILLVLPRSNALCDFLILMMINMLPMLLDR